MRKLLQQTRVMPRLARAVAAQGRGADAQKTVMATPLDCYECVLTRGDVAALRRDWRDAGAWYAQAVRLGPSLPFGYTSWGQMLLQKGDLDGAIAQFERAHQRGPAYADPLELWGE